MTNSCLAVPETRRNKVEKLREEWDALSREEKRNRALNLIREDGYSQRGLAKALQKSEATLRYYLNLGKGKSTNSADPCNTAEGSSPERATTALSAIPATKDIHSAELIDFLKEIDIDGMHKRRAAKELEERKAARIAHLVLAFAGFLAQNYSLEPQLCLQMVGLIETRLNEMELSRHLPQPLPAGVDARRVLPRIPPQPHTEWFEQVVYRAVVGLLYLGENPDMRRQILRGLAELFRLEIQRVRYL